MTDVLKLTAYPIAGALVLTAFGSVLGLGLIKDETINDRIREGRTVQFIRRFSQAIVVVYFTALIPIIIFAPPWKWHLLPAFVALPFVVAANRYELLSSLIQNEKLRSIFLFIIIVLLPSSYGLGVTNADVIVTSKQFDYVLSKVDGFESRADSEPINRLRFLGHAGEFMFLRDPLTQALVIAKFESDKPLVLKRFIRGPSPKQPVSQVQSISPPLK